MYTVHQSIHTVVFIINTFLLIRYQHARSTPLMRIGEGVRRDFDGVAASQPKVEDGKPHTFHECHGRLHHQCSGVRHPPWPPRRWPSSLHAPGCCRCFELPPTSKFLILRVWLGWCAKKTRGLYWFGQNVPTSSSLLLLVLLALKVRNRGYKRSREGQVPSLW